MTLKRKIFKTLAHLVLTILPAGIYNFQKRKLENGRGAHEIYKTFSTNKI